MKKKFTETQIVSAIKKHESGIKATEVARELGISAATLYNWKAKYGGMEVSELKKYKDLEIQHNKLKLLVADLLIENNAIKSVLEKKF
jgi:putative transposase